MDQDVLTEEQALQAVLDNGDFGGFDNDALDFQHLEDYINGDDDNNIYFPDSLVGSEVKSAEIVHGHPQNHDTAVNIHVSKNVGTTPSTILYGVPTSSPYSKNGPQSISVGHHLNHFSHPHLLPESPPDSGSEPPFSPPDEEPKSTQVGSLTEMLLQPLPVNMHTMKHMIPQYPRPPMPTPMSMPVPLPSLPMHAHSSHQVTLSPTSTVRPPNPPPLPPSQPNLAALTIPALFASPSPSDPLQPNKKRKLSESPTNAAQNGNVHIKQEPGSRLAATNGSGPVNNSTAAPGPNTGSTAAANGPQSHPPPLPPRQCLSPDAASNQSNSQALDDDFGFDFGSDNGMGFVDSAYQCIQFQPFQQNSWHNMCDRNLKELVGYCYRVDADKGFNFSHADDAFVCQKKNHFQVTVHVQTASDPHFVQTPEGLKKIDAFFVHFYGVKVESPSQTIKVEQSQSDRSKKPFHPVMVDVSCEQATKMTVGRLHFSETTSNNMRKKGKPNPDQRYFYLVVALHAHCGDNSYPVSASASERIIVRASNPGQFESDAELSWQKGHTSESIFHAGRVGINTDRPDEALVVHGNIRLTGHIVQPSDIRTKQNIQEVDTKETLRNMQQLRLVRYEYNLGFAEHAGLDDDERCDTGVIAQEVQKVIPEAVKEVGDLVLPNGERIDNFLVVNKDRIFIENIGAIKELCKVTDNLGNRIDELERMNRKLSKPRRIDSLKSTSSASTIVSRTNSVRVPSTPSSKKPFSRRRHLLDERGLCSNKFVQVTIVILILVMALCLVAMATLYILEWQKRQVYDISAGAANAELNALASKANGSNSSYGFVGPPDLRGLNLTGTLVKITTVISSSSRRNRTVTPSTTTKAPLNGSQMVVRATSSALTVRVQGKRAVLGAPPACTGSAHRCQSFCCNDPPGIDVGPPISAQLRSKSAATTGPLTTGAATSSSTSSTSAAINTSTMRSAAEAPAPRMMMPSNDDIKNEEEDSEESDNGGNLSIDSQNGNNGMMLHNKFLSKMITLRKNVRQKRRVNMLNRNVASSVMKVRLVELNYTFSSQDCSSCSPLNVTYNVPVSRYMIQQTLTLQFVLNYTENIYIDYCQTGNKITECSHPSGQNSEEHFITDDPTAERKSHEFTPSWILPIGLFVESSYKFRISNINNHLQVCLTNSTQSFIEYNFLFYRSCED